MFENLNFCWKHIFGLAHQNLSFVSSLIHIRNRFQTMMYCHQICTHSNGLRTIFIGKNFVISIHQAIVWQTVRIMAFPMFQYPDIFSIINNVYVDYRHSQIWNILFERQNIFNKQLIVSLLCSQYIFNFYANHQRNGITWTEVVVKKRLKLIQ